MNKCPPAHSCYNVSTCAGECPPLAAAEWLALEGAEGGFALDMHQPTESSLKSLSEKSFLKKSEERSSSLPAGKKQLVPAGSEVQIKTVDGEKPPVANGYWLVTLA